MDLPRGLGIGPMMLRCGILFLHVNLKTDFLDAGIREQVELVFGGLPDLKITGILIRQGHLLGDPEILANIRYLFFQRFAPIKERLIDAAAIFSRTTIPIPAGRRNKMPYPKPLSEKSIERLYREAGIGEEVRTWLHTLFAACANFYGALPLRAVWSLYREIDGAPKIRRKDLIAFSAIVRREKQPYYVFEIEELYTEEPHNELDRHIVSGELVSCGYGKLHLFYRLTESLDGRPYCLPDDLLSFADPVPTPEETALLSFLGNLKSTADICKPKYGRSCPNENKGKKLSAFSFLNALERSELEYYENRPAILADLKKDSSGTEAEKILRLFKRGENIDPGDMTRHLEYMTEELEEVGVRLTEQQLKKLLGLVTAFHNNSHLWGLSGWKPVDLARMMPVRGTPAISFGPGLQKAFADGTMNREELMEGIRKLGLDVID